MYSVGDRVRVRQFRIIGYWPGVDEDTGEPCRQPHFAEVGSNWATVVRTRAMGGEFVVAKFDQPIPGINDESQTSALWSVHSMDIAEHVPAECIPVAASGVQL